MNECVNEGKCVLDRRCYASRNFNVLMMTCGRFGIPEGVRLAQPYPNEKIPIGFTFFNQILSSFTSLTFYVGPFVYSVTLEAGSHIVESSGRIINTIFAFLLRIFFTKL